MKKLFLSAIVFCSAMSSMAQELQLSLDSCLAMAIRNNKEIAISRTKEEIATLNRKEAFTKYLPQFDAVGAYVHSGQEISILNNDQKSALSNFGTNTTNALIQSEMGQSVIQTMTGLVQKYPNLAPLVNDLASVGTALMGQMQTTLNGVGQQIVDAFRTDNRNMGVISLSLTQPLFMGGKIVAYNKITKYAENIAKAQTDAKVQDLVVSVETAYWQLVALQGKRDLAVSYKNLIDTLDNQVQAMIEEGVATKADGLSVKVKQNEADVTLIQLDNGIALCKMLLCQLVGLDVNTPVQPSDKIVLNEKMDAQSAQPYVDAAWSNRPELTALGLLNQVNKEKVKVTRADLMPQVVMMGNYLWSNPNVLNGFDRHLSGTWNVGVAVRVPLTIWGGTRYKLKAAKAEYVISQTNLEEIREKIELQTTQCTQKVQEASKRQETASRSMAQAEENLRYANIGMEEGVIPVSNVMAAQTAWLGAKSAVLDAQIDLRLAQVNLKRAMGTINR